MAKKRWLMKSEPDVYGWDDLVAEGEGTWDGVRNHTAARNLREMQRGDEAFFYHSNIGLEVVGIAEVCALSHPDSTTEDPRWDCVDIRAVEPLPRKVTLKEIKATPELANMALVTSMRLSVQPVTPEEWAIVCRMGGLAA